MWRLLRFLRHSEEEERWLELGYPRKSFRGIRGLKYYFSEERYRIKERYLFFVIYLYTLTTFQVDSKAVYRFVGQIGDILDPFSKYFKKIDVLVNRWGFKQDRACIITSLKIPSRLLRDFFYRLAYNLSIGANFNEFIRMEYQKFIIDYDYYFQKTIDKLRIISDVYTALLDAAIIVSMTAILASILFGATSTYSIMVIILAILFVSLFTALSIIKVNIPIDIKYAHDMPFRPKRLRMLDRVARYILFLICGMSFLPVILPYFILNNERFITDTVAYSLEIALLYIVPGVLGLIIGKLGLMEIKNIEEYDSVYPVFISVLGEAASLAGSLKEGLRRILKNDYGRLTYAIRRLYYRLNMDVDSKVAWRLFYEELGSNLIRYLTRIFIDAVSRGANIKESSLVIYDTSVRFAKRRHGRTQIFNYFKGMAIPLQATFVAVLTLIVVLISLFTRFSATISSFILYIEVPDISLLLIFVYLMMTIISIGNSWAIYLLKGDSIYTFIYYLGLSLIISGGMFALMAIGSSSILEAFIRFERGLGNVFIP